MLIVPTGDLVGLLSDVLPFADPSKDSPNFGVLIEWDGEALHAHATDSLSAGISTWDLDNIDRDLAEQAEQLGVHYGPTQESEPRWRVFVGLDDAKEIVKTFKLAFKFRGVPLHVKVNESRSRFMVERTRDTGKTEHVMSVQPVHEHEGTFPDLRAQIARAEQNVQPSTRIPVYGHRLAALEHAGRHGVIEQIPIAFADSELVVVRAGEAFVGFVTPENKQARRLADKQSDVLRNGSGVLLSEPATA